MTETIVKDITTKEDSIIGLIGIEEIVWLDFGESNGIRSKQLEGAP